MPVSDCSNIEQGGVCARIVRMLEAAFVFVSAQGVTFIVNDRADVARAAEASGVHVGQEDLQAEGARS